MLYSIKKKPDSITVRLLAEKEGFEPPGQLCRPADFESAPFDHSGISPRQKYKNLLSSIIHHKKFNGFYHHPSLQPVLIRFLKIGISMELSITPACQWLIRFQ